MLDTDRAEFVGMLKAILKTYRVEPDAEVLRLYWGVLSKHSIQHVRAGLSAFVSNPANKFSVTPAHLVESIESIVPDGRPGADEAWALYPHDETSSAVITDEMADAMRVAMPLLDDGDRIGARMAFKDAYTRIVAHNKAAGIPVRWFPSLGTDREGRELAISHAVQLGRISHEHASGLLPAVSVSLKSSKC